MLHSLLLFVALAAPTAQDSDVVARWSAADRPAAESFLADATGRWIGATDGGVKTVEIGPATAYDFNGRTVVKLADAPAAVKHLPTEKFSVSGWMFVHRPAAWGGFVGLMQDNGGEETGWSLGYNDAAYTFTLSTAGADDGDGLKTHLTSKTPLALDRWVHLAATYDGQTMRLYVNGKADATSKEQSGPIRYPQRGAFVLGGYLDDNERQPLAGAIRDLTVRRGALTAEQVRAEFEKNKELAAYVPPVDPNLKFVVKPYLQFPTTDSIIVMCQLNRPARVTVEYGVSAPNSKKAVFEADTTIPEMKLSGLKPATNYFYRVVAEDADGYRVESATLTFATAVGPDDAFAFTVVGDSQNNPPVTADIAAAAYSHRPNFQLHVGDLVGDGRQDWQWTDEFFPPSHVLMGRVAVFPVLGNHEVDDQNYYNYFALPGPEYYYRFHYGNADFFVIDTNRDVGPESEQYRWLETALKDSDATWKIVAHHHPIYTSDSNDPVDPEHRRLTKLYDKYDVDLVFHGHIHMYERTWPIRDGKINASGTRYIDTGGSGGFLEQFAPWRSWFTQELRRGHHFCYVSIHGETLVFKAFDREHRLFDQFTLRKTDAADAGGEKK